MEMREPDGTTYTFGKRATGDPYVKGLVYYLTKVEDRNGNAIPLAYSRLGGGLDPNAFSYRLGSILDTYGRTISFTYGTAGVGSFLASIADFDGRVVTFGYGADNNLTSVTSTAGKKTEYVYGTDGAGENGLTKIFAPTEIAARGPGQGYGEGTP